MRVIKFTNQWAKDLKKVKQYPDYKANKLDAYQKMIAAGEPLPPSAKDHPLAKHNSGMYKGLRDFHLSPNLCVLYNIGEDEVVFYRIGKHNILGLTEMVTEKLSVKF